MAEPFELTYRARDGRPPVNLNLHITADGHAELFIGTSTSIPVARVDRIGTFAGQAPANELQAIHDYLAKHDLVSRAGTFGQAGPGTPNRFLALTVGEQHAEFKLNSGQNDATIDGFERLLHHLALAMIDQPLSAVEASLDLQEAEGQITPTITMQAIGSEPMTVLLVDPAQPVFTLYAQVELRGTKTSPGSVTFPAVLGSIAFPTETVQAMAESGELPSGVTKLPRDATYRFELPPIALPVDASAITATGSIDFWLPDGKARSSLSLQTATIPLT